MINNNYRARIALIFMLFVIGYSVVVIRLFFMQVYHDDFYSNLAQNQYQMNVKINASRGKIFDRYGQTLAYNNDVWSAYLLPRQLMHKEKTLALLQEHFPESALRFNAYTNKHFMWIDRMASFEKKTLLESLQPHDIKYMKEPHRFYPYQALQNVIGVTDVDNVGIAGIELMYDAQLKGVPEFITLQKDARFKHFYFDRNIGIPGCAGSSITLSIDAPLQILIYEALKNTVTNFEAIEGSVLIMNPDNGEVLTMAHYVPPQEIFSNKLDQFKNGIVTQCYELGSVLKVFAALASLDEKVVQFDEKIDCEGKIAYLHKFKVENWKYTEVEPFYEVIKKSSNIGIAKVSLRLGSKLYDHLRKVGFGEKTGIEFPGERSGFVMPPEKWSKSSPIVLSFGYEVMMTILQLGTAMSIIANGGYAIQPTIIKNNVHKNASQQVYQPSSIEHIKNILSLIGARYKVSDCMVMGKTGTARIAEEGGYSTQRHLYTFAGIIEKADYRRVIVTFLKEPKKANLWASETAAPLFQQVAEIMVAKDLIDA